MYMAIATCSNRLYLLNMYRYIHGHSGINKVFELLSWSPTRIDTSVALLHYSYTRASRDSRKIVGRAIVTSPALRSAKRTACDSVLNGAVLLVRGAGDTLGELFCYDSAELRI